MPCKQTLFVGSHGALPKQQAARPQVTPVNSLGQRGNALVGNSYQQSSMAARADLRMSATPDRFQASNQSMSFKQNMSASNNGVNQRANQYAGLSSMGPARSSLGAFQGAQRAAAPRMMASNYQMPVNMMLGGNSGAQRPTPTPKGMLSRSSEAIIMNAEVPSIEPVGFNRYVDGYLMCDKLSVKDIAERATYSPFYLMSKSQLRQNFEAYRSALEGLDSAFIGYAVKANHNMHVMRYLAGLGCGAVLVSGNELRTAIQAGFSTDKMVFNGNGKMQEELNLAVDNNVLVNIDSEFDLKHIIEAGKVTGKKARAMLRINPDVDPKVHPYVSTGMAGSKFGIENAKINEYLAEIRANSDYVELVGAHCHIGSTIKDVTIFRDAAEKMVEYVDFIRNEGFDLQYLNIGGGLGIDYERKGEIIPTPKDLIDTVRDLIVKMDLKLIIEPGRSMVGNTTIFVNKITGVKSNGTKNFIVTDGSMSELIRPSLYDTYQHIEIAEPCAGEVKKFDIVGPVCESADFLGKDRELPTPEEGMCLIVYDAGAYCQAMSSVYNMKLTCPEYWVDGDELFQVRKDPDLDQYLSVFDDVPKSVKM